VLGVLVVVLVVVSVLLDPSILICLFLVIGGGSEKFQILLLRVIRVLTTHQS